MAEYRHKMVDIQDVPAPDALVIGEASRDMIHIVAGSYRRGMLLMSGDEGFVPATSAGIASASELCILSESMEVPEGHTLATLGYFAGEFSAASVILPWEGEEDNHDELMAAVHETLRKHNIYVK